MNPMRILVGCEESQAVAIALRAQGHEAYSCDLKPCSGGYPQWHLQMDVFKAIAGGQLITQHGNEIFIESWDMGIFFPDCTYLTCSAEWAYKDGPYHQKVKPGTLVGAERRNAREGAIEFVKALYNSGISKVAIENPVGVLSNRFRKPDQVVQPYDFGDDASKATCLWLLNLPKLQATSYKQPRIVGGKERWANQTDSGQNKLPPSENRAELRSKTYPGIARAMAIQWTAPAPPALFCHTCKMIEKMNEKITLDYSVGDHPHDPDTLVITVKGTGLSCANPKHVETIKACVQPMIPYLYAAGHGIPLNKVRVTNRIKK